jgi:hypothetical protein
MDRKKNLDLKYCTGINCVEDPRYCYEKFKRVFEYYAQENFDEPGEKHPSGKVKNIKLFHYVQSFNPTDKITPELAHKIGVEFAKSTAFRLLKTNPIRARLILYGKKPKRESYGKTISVGG